MAGTGTTPITAERLVEMGDIGRCELIYGELVMMSPAGADHGVVALRIGRFLGEFVDQHQLGLAFAAETGYIIERHPDLIRAPDASFIVNDRIKNISDQYIPGVPDLAVEVTSPGESRRYVLEKVNMWLAHGTQTVWVIDPGNSTVAIRRVGEPVKVLTQADEISDEPLLPGFTLSCRRLFHQV